MTDERPADRIYDAWLEYELDEARALARASDLLEFAALDDHHFVARFTCRGLVCEPGGAVEEHEEFEVGIRLDTDYLRCVADPMRVIQVLSPLHVFHPNLNGPVLCLGVIHPGTSIVQLLYRAHAVLTWQEYVSLEHDSLNRDACVWARRNADRLPIDPRPIKRRTRSVALDGLQVTP
jgi:hypothetical protein